MSRRTPPLLAVALAALAASGCASRRPERVYTYFPEPPAPPRVVHLLSFNRMSGLVDLKTTWVEVIRGGQISPFVGTPAGMAWRDGVLYICDTDANFVHVWNLNEGTATRLGEDGRYPLAKPVGVAVGEDGTVYIADTVRNDVVSFKPGGAAGTRFVPPEREAFRPTAVAVRGNEVYVADIASLGVDVFDAATGNYLRSIVVPTGGERRAFPMGVTFDHHGRLVVTDAMGSRVVVVGDEGAEALVLGRPGDRYGDLGQPRQVAVSAGGEYVITDAGFPAVHLFNDAGQLLILLAGDASGEGPLPMPVGVVLAADVPASMARLVPENFSARFYFIAGNTIGDERLSLFAVGGAK